MEIREKALDMTLMIAIQEEKAHRLKEAIRMNRNLLGIDTCTLLKSRPR
jgi:hypothetical protein